MPEQSGKKKTQTANERRQTFYNLFQKGNVEDGNKKKKKRKNKATAPAESFPRFNLSRYFAKVDLVTANQVLAKLEQGEMPPGRVCICGGEDQICEFQEMLLAFKKECELLLITAFKQGAEKVQGCKEVWLPWHGNLANVQACAAMIDRSAVELTGETPVDVKTAVAKKELVALRTTIVLKRAQEKHRKMLKQFPASCMKLLDASQSIKTDGWCVEKGEPILTGCVRASGSSGGHHEAIWNRRNFLLEIEQRCAHSL